MKLGPNDIALIDKIIQVCDADWLNKRAVKTNKSKAKKSLIQKSPYFYVATRTGNHTILNESISSHFLK